MEKSAETIGKPKFQRLSSKGQHKILAQWAETCQVRDDLKGFLIRYREMHGWADLDSYRAPSWLASGEALEEYAAFHRQRAGQPKPAIRNSLEGGLSWEARFEVVVVIDQVRSPYNLGSILRLIDNFGLAKLVHASDSLSLQHSQLIKAARGSETWIPVERKADLHGYLKAVTDPVIGLEKAKSAVSLTDWQPPRRFHLILGNEAYGIAASLRGLCDELVAIPTFGFKKSMNVHHAFAIACQKIVENHS